MFSHLSGVQQTPPQQISSALQATPLQQSSTHAPLQQTWLPSPHGVWFAFGVQVPSFGSQSWHSSQMGA
jgi:hypothetical protein